MNNVAIVLVLFRPTEGDISNIERISGTFEGVVVDNSPSRNFDGDLIGNLHYIFIGENRGIAEAQNIGIDFLIRDNKWHYIVFLDQDSRIAVNYLEEIIGEYAKIKTFMPNLSMLGPTLINARSKEQYRSVFHSRMVMKDLFIPQREIISSGSCVSVDVLKKVGGNLSWLFIDYVDFEWCWRANSMGYVCGITPNVSIQHSVGQKEYYICNYIIIISSPIRYYYQGRNYIKLLSMSYVPLQWKLTNLVKTLVRILYLPFVHGGGIKCWKQLIKGLYFGLVRKV